MKSFLCKLNCFLTEIGYARAAAELSRAGKFKEAQQLAQMRRDCKC